MSARRPARGTPNFTPRRPPRGGTTLAELMLAAAISMMLIVVVGMMVTGYARNFRSVTQRGITLQAMAVGLDRMRLETLEASSIEVPTDASTGTLLLFHRPDPGNRTLCTTPEKMATVQYNLRPDGGLWRKFTDVEGKITESPVAFDIAKLVCSRKGPLLELQLVPREGPPMTARLAVGMPQ